MALVYGSLFVLSMLLTINVVPIIAALARRHGFVDLPGERKIHREPIPYGGGLAVALGFLATLALAIACVYLEKTHHIFQILSPEVLAYVPNVFLRTDALVTLIGLACVILALGMLDDRNKLPIWIRLVVEVGAALAFALSVARLDLFGASPAISVPLTVAWIVVVTNMFNLLDHFDGLSSGVVIVAGLCYFLVAVITQQLFIASITITLIGATFGFFLFNRPPARIFLGDGGSLFLGFMLSTLTVLFTFYKAKYGWYTYAVPVAVLAVPIFDTTLVILIRLCSGRSIFVGDTNHLAHRLTALGLHPRAVLAVVLGLTLVSGISTILLYQVDELGAGAILIQLLLVFIIVTTLEVSGRREGK